jgi:glutathione S-transferase kappa 1
MWISPHANITLSGPLREAILKSNIFSNLDVDLIMAKAADKEWKDKLTANTKEALDLGAFGAPWMMVTNGQGVTEPFFGSDRWHFIWEFLGLPYRDLEVLLKGKSRL